MKNSSLFGILLILVFQLHALDLPKIEDEVPPAPVIGSLTAVLSGNFIELSWKPVPDMLGKNVILRSDRPITASNYTSVQIVAEIPHNQTNYLDTIESDGEYYYAVLSYDEAGTAYDFFLPANNSLLVPITVGSINQNEPVKISVFDTVVRNDAVLITWTSKQSGRNLILYRSTAPFSNTNSLVQAVVVDTIIDDGSPYVDYPVPGVPYFYAIIDEALLRSGQIVFRSGENTNRIPLEVSTRFAKIRRGSVSPLRPMPLPWLNPGNEITMQPGLFSTKTEKQIKKTISLSKKTMQVSRTPFVFTMDMEKVSGGEEQALKIILQKFFIPGNWKETTVELKKFISIRRTPETVARVHFYLGESLYFSGDYQEALLEFLLSYETYYNQSREWIQYVLEELIRVN